MTQAQLTTAPVSVQNLRTVVAIAVQRRPEQRARIEKAGAILLLRDIRPDPTFLDCYRVQSATDPDTWYDCDDGVGVCSCPDHQKRGVRCCHLWALRLLAALAKLERAPAIAVVTAA